MKLKQYQVHFCVGDRRHWYEHVEANNMLDAAEEAVINMLNNREVCIPSISEEPIALREIGIDNIIVRSLNFGFEVKLPFVFGK